MNVSSIEVEEPATNSQGQNVARTEELAIEQWLEKEDSDKYQHIGADQRQKNQNNSGRSWQTRSASG